MIQHNWFGEVRQLYEVGVIPVVTVASSDDAIPIADALIRGGLPCAEITFRTDAAAAAIERIRAHAPGMFLAAGTVLTPVQVDRAVDAGAQLIVAPGFNSAVVDHCRKRAIPVMPGVATPSEVEQAYAQGLKVLKFFPAGALGGVTWLKALAGPYPMISFVPTGGVNPANLADYLALSNVAAVGGTWLVKPDLVAARDFATIERLALEATAIVARVRPAPASVGDATSVASGFQEVGR